MRITQPDYYEEFSCIAGDCPDTCCVGWQVVVDEEHLRIYQSAKGTLGDQLRSSIVEIDGEPCFSQCNGRCCMLREDGLCTIQKELGEAALSQVCGFYPRFVTELGLLREQGLSISCPEAARIILRKKEPVRFVTHTTDEPLRYFHDIEPETIFAVKKGRDEAISAIQDRTQPLYKRLVRFLQIAGTCSEDAPASDREYAAFRAAMYDCFLSLEQLRPDWTERLQRGREASGIEKLDENTAWEQLLCYYIFKYSLRAAMDEDFEEKMRLAALNLLLLQELYALGESSLVHLVQLFAKETEHNDDNLDALTNALSENLLFSAQSLCRIFLRFGS